jgi:hypothetical protein
MKNKKESASLKATARQGKIKKEKGLIIINSLVFGTIAIMLISALSLWFGTVLKLSRNAFDNERAFQVAEAGIDYYRWHLAKDPDDFTNGQNVPGPYVNDFFDISGNKIGEYSLSIIPPNNNGVVTIESTGTVINNPKVSRTIRVKMAKTSFAKFAFVTDSEVRFNSGIEIFGPIHANGGIRFDGIANGIISSAKEFYDDPSHAGNYEFGVHTHVTNGEYPNGDPVWPNDVPVRNDVFKAGRKFPVPAIDFDSITANLNQLKILSQTQEGFYRGPSSNKGYGYEVELKPNGIFELREVTNLMKPHASCIAKNQGEQQWGTWSISNTGNTTIHSYPENGIMFFEDNVWIKGQIDNEKITIIASGTKDNNGQGKNIIVNEDVLYTNYDGSDAIGLIAQNNFNIGMISENDLQIDAAIVAKTNRVGRHYYSGEWNNHVGCSPDHVKNSIKINGMIASKEPYGLAFNDNTGYQSRTIVYDSNLMFNPPPGFPLVGSYYETISFQEI